MRTVLRSPVGQNGSACTSSVTASEGRLGVDQTTVARRLAAAEAALGTRLYERRAGSLYPTESGQTAIAHAARIEHDVDALERGARDSDVDAAGSVRVTAVPVLVNRLLAPSLPAFSAGYARLRLELMAE